ncbi:hypothetical protein VTK73DRAFT_1374 [Phialemonium thermophilum]|uniref:Uncharacterized protein n=1 Tax=Phialemonium thermophilum TaxID=223376 RepID=A0ABR3X9Z8_9PEZI
MADNTVYLITGANKGIGLGLAIVLLARPSTTVIGTFRPSTAPNTPTILAALPHHPTSIAVAFPLDEDDAHISSATVSARLTRALEDAGLTEPPNEPRLDVVIANAGGATGPFADVTTTDPADALNDFAVNALGPLRLFQACWPLMVNGAGGREGQKKFVLITSSVGSIGCLEQESFPSTAYGMSKVAANWLARKASIEFASQGLKVGIIHPGWVKTAMGQALADAVNVKEPPMTVEDSAKRVLQLVDHLSAENSGKFVSYDGQPLPW